MATVDDFKLIECVQNYPNIYDKNHGEYRNKRSKMNAWINIGREVSVPGTLCEQRWAVLRNRYTIELRLRRLRRRSNKNTWPYFKAMSFLIDYITPRRTRGGGLLYYRETRSFTEKEDIKPLIVSSERLVTTERLKTVTRLRPIAPRPAIISTTVCTTSVTTQPTTVSTIASSTIAPVSTVYTTITPQSAICNTVTPQSAICNTVTHQTAICTAVTPQSAICTAVTPQSAICTTSVTPQSAIPTGVSITTPAVATGLFAFPSVSDSLISSGIHSNFSYQTQYNGSREVCKEKQEVEDEDILFGKSIGYTLKAIKNNRVKLQVKSGILAVLAQYAE